MKLEEYEKLEQLKKDLDLGESWKIGYAWDDELDTPKKCVFKDTNPRDSYQFRGIVNKVLVSDMFKYAEEVPKPKAPKYRPFKNYAEFVKHWPSEKRLYMYVKTPTFIFSLYDYNSGINFDEVFKGDTILTEEQVINEDYENGLPFGVLEEAE